MSQLHKRSRMAAVAMGILLLALLIAATGVVTTTVTAGAPQADQAKLDVLARVSQLHDSVEAASTSEAKYDAYWGSVCDAKRAFERLSDDEHAIRNVEYTDLILDFYWELNDSDQFPYWKIELNGKEELVNSIVKDGSRLLIGYDDTTRESDKVCDYKR